MDENIRHIKDKFDDRLLSFIIGAGFSKNLYNDFPLWTDLLSDIVEELYQDEIEQAYVAQSEDKMDYRNFCKDKVTRIIKREGYLKTASDYIRRRGYRECIDDYIEKRTPYLVRTDTGLALYRDGERIAQQESLDLRVHKALFALNVQDIYTFNYDNLLELTFDADREEELQQKRYDIQQESAEFEQLVIQYEEKRQAVEEERTMATTSEEWQLQDSDRSSMDSLRLFYEQQIKPYLSISDDSSLYYIDSAIEEKKMEYLSSLEQIDIECKQLYHKVNRSWDISLSSGRKNIYKLHGDLRIDKSHPYGFDNDINHHYIICQEDYDSYATRHEAFVNLMKISLLKGSVCVIGFSGDDSNFLNWMSWVRSILQKRNNRNSVQKHVFFIDAIGTELPSDKRLLFENNYIQYVSLENIYHTKNATENLLCFFDELKDHSGDYDVLLNEATKSSNANAISRLWQWRSQYYLPKLDGGLNREHRRDILSKYRNKIPFTNEQAQEFIIALTDERLFIHNVLRNDWNKAQISDSDTRNAIDLLEIREQIVENQPIQIDINRGDPFYYERILQLLFTFEYDEAYKLLQQWNPCGFGQVRRLAMLSIFERPDRKKVNAAIFDKQSYSSLQEYIYALNILPNIRGTYTQRKGGGMTAHDDVRPIIAKLVEHYPSLHELHEDIALFKKDLLQNDNTSVKAYGANNWSYTFGRIDNKLLRATQLLQTFIELGLPMNGLLVNYLDVKIWYAAFKKLFKEYPYPCIYFSLQYGTDKQFMKRIAQDYAYSSELRTILPKLLDRLLHAYQCDKTPNNVSEGILHVCTFWLRCVDSTIWKNAFRKVVERCDLQSTDINRTRLDPIYDFINVGLQVSTDTRLKQNVWLACLKKQADIDYIDNSLIIAACRGLKSIHSTIKIQIDNLLKICSKPAHFYVLENMKKYMNRSQRDRLRELVRTYNYAKGLDVIMFEIAARYLSRKNSDLYTTLKSAIIESPQLWYTGIKDDGVITGGEHYIRLSHLQKLQWDKDEIGSIYTKLTKAVRAIDSQQYHGFPFVLLNWRSLLLEMILFMNRYHGTLCENANYAEVHDLVRKLYQKELGAPSLIDALTSSNENIVRHGIEQLVYDIQMGKINSNMTEYLVVANRILMRMPTGLNSCFSHYVWSLSEYMCKFPKAIFLPISISIMEGYQCYFDGSRSWDIDAAMEKIESALICLYQTCRKRGYSNSFWDRYIPRFTDIP